MQKYDKKLNRDGFSSYYVNDNTQKEFFKIFRLLSEEFGATYMSYVYEDLHSKKRASFATNPDWLKRYVGDGLINHCHLWTEVTKSFLNTENKRYILPWDAIKGQNRKQKNIIYERTDHEIGANGVSFCSDNNGIIEYLAVAPDLKNSKFQMYLAKNLLQIKMAACQLRKLVTETQLNSSTQQGDIVVK